MKKEMSFAHMTQSSTKDLKDLLLQERDMLMRIRFSKKIGDTKGYESKLVRKKIARIQTALSIKKKGGL